MWQCIIYGWLHFLFLITGVFGCIIVLHPVCTYHSTNTPNKPVFFRFVCFFYFSALHKHSMRILHYHDLEKSVLFNCTKWLILHPKLPNESLKLQELISQQCSSFFFLLSLAGGWQERGCPQSQYIAVCTVGFPSWSTMHFQARWSLALTFATTLM